MIWWQKIGSFLSYVIILGIISLTVHEFFHFIILKILGGEGYVTYTLQSGLTHVTAMPKNLFLFSAGGGVLTSLLFFFVWIWTRLSKTKHDLNLEFSLAIWMGVHFFYGVGEGVLSTTTSLGILILIGALIPILFYAPQF